MPDRFVFSVHYEEALMKSAVRRYLFRAIVFEHNWISVAAFFGVLVCAGLVLTFREFDFTTGLFAGLLVGLFMLIGIVVLGHWSGIRAKLRRMKQPRETFRLRDDEFNVEADSGASTLKWDAFRDVWEFEGVWLLMMSSNQFVTLPLRDVPADALLFVKSKVARRPL
jgi:hypothetical protein